MLFSSSVYFSFHLNLLYKTISDKIQSHVASLNQKCHSSLKTSKNERCCQNSKRLHCVCKLHCKSRKSIWRISCIIFFQWRLRYACLIYRILLNGLRSGYWVSRYTPPLGTSPVECSMTLPSYQTSSKRGARLFLNLIGRIGQREIRSPGNTNRRDKWLVANVSCMDKYLCVNIVTHELELYRHQAEIDNLYCRPKSVIGLERRNIHVS
jgi:hypothetical protein